MNLESFINKDARKNSPRAHADSGTTARAGRRLTLWKWLGTVPRLVHQVCRHRQADHWNQLIRCTSSDSPMAPASRATAKWTARRAVLDWNLGAFLLGPPQITGLTARTVASRVRVSEPSMAGVLF